MRNKEQLDKIKYLVIDVDGTMTDAGIYYDEHGNELKSSVPKTPPVILRRIRREYGLWC